MPRRDPPSPDRADPRPPLTRDRILDAAIELADDDGVDALTMRRLARRLGFEVMSLYNHVANKDDLLAGVADRLAAELSSDAASSPAGSADWRVVVRERVIAAHRLLLRRRWLVHVWTDTRSGPHLLAFQESLLRTLREAGFSADLAYHGYHALMIHLFGFARQEAAVPMSADELVTAAASARERLAPDEHPYLREHLSQHLDAHDPTEDFEFVLDLVLDGLERLRAGPT